MIGWRLHFLQKIFLRDMEDKKKIRREIVSLMRGYYFTNIFCSLIDAGVLTEKTKSIKINNIKKINKDRLFFALEYLKNLGILRKKRNEYFLTKNGRLLLLRSGAFQIPFSYKNYLSNTQEFIFKGKNFKCERSMNVIGSGDTHSRKFFKPVIQKFNFNKYDQIVDLGCGDGTFLKHILKNNKNIRVTASDVSKEALKNTKSNLKDYKNVDYILSNALNINKWAKKIKFGDKVLICFWFIIHEIFSNEKDLVNFFKKLNIKKFDILICEINRVDSKILKENLDYTLMPEYFYFHDISNQKLFSEKDLNKMLIKSSYKRIENFKFDQYRSKNRNIPSIYTGIYSN